MDILDSIVYSYDLSILKDIYMLEGLFNKKDFYDVEKVFMILNIITIPYNAIIKKN